MKGFFEEKFIIENLNRIPTISGDPKMLGYLRLPMNLLYTGIHSYYKRASTPKAEITVVLPLSPTEVGLMKKMMKTEQCCSFSIFLRGFTNHKHADAKQKALREKGEKVYRLIINFPKDKKKMNTELDKGFYIYESASEEIMKEGNVVFNIMNFFTVSRDSDP